MSELLCGAVGLFLTVFFPEHGTAVLHFLWSFINGKNICVMMITLSES